MSPMNKLTIYLSGPLEGTNLEDRRGWRDQMVEALKDKFDFNDPVFYTPERDCNSYS